VSAKCNDENSLLAIPACVNSTGECQSEKIIVMLEQYQLKDDIQGLVFDTTASNTGREKGVNTRLNQYLEKPVLHLACRHHVFERHVKNVKLYRPTCGPEHPLFKRLSEVFLNISIDQAKLCKYPYGRNSELDNAARESLNH
jgi:hypothetical protein